MPDRTHLPAILREIAETWDAGHTPTVRQLHSTNDHGAVYAVPDVRDVFVEYHYATRRLYCSNCDSSRCEHIDMVQAHRRQQQRIMQGA